MTQPNETHGAFSWSELMTSDPAGAMKFYQALFGWTFAEFPMEEGSYHVVKVEGAERAGIMKTPPEAEGMPPNWGIYITVSNVDETASKVEALGGKVLVGPRDIPNVGRFCVIQDPQGAYVSAITYEKM